MKILVMGGTSFFGRETAIKAFEAGHDVCLFSRRAPVDGIPLDIKQVRGDRTVEADLSRITLDTWDIVFDNICYTQEDAQKAVKKFSGRAGLYVMTSSEAVYYLIKDLSSPFRETHTEIFRENVELKRGGFWDYASGKYMAEQVFLEAFRNSSFPLTIVRPPIIIGPNDNTLRAYSYWLRIADGQPFFAPGLGFSKRFAYSGDMAMWLNTIFSSQEKVIGKVFNLGDSEILSLGEFLKISADIMGKPLLAIAASFQWLKENGFDMSASPYSSKKDYIMDISKAYETLDLKSTPVREWIKKSIEWFMFDYAGMKPKNYESRQAEIELCLKWQRQGENVKN